MFLTGMHQNDPACFSLTRLVAAIKREEHADCPRAISQCSTSSTPAFSEISLVNVSNDSFELPPEPNHEQIPMARFVCGTGREGSYFSASQHQFQSTVASAPTSFTFDQLQLSSNVSATQLSHSALPTRAYIPRPPNAFMLFRSDFLRRGIVPSHVERRQQNLSRVAGQCWNLLSPEEKGKWQDEAMKVSIEHKTRNPDYKFTPAPRGTRRPKGKGRPDSNAEKGGSEDRIRKIREQYTQLAGPAATPARRRPRTGGSLVKTAKYEDTISRQTPQKPLPPSLPPSPSLSSESDSCLSQYSFRDVVPSRRPSTTLGFYAPSSLHNSTTSMLGHSLIRPSSAAFSATDLSTPLRDLDIARSIRSTSLVLPSCSYQTPTTTTFGTMSVLTMPSSSPMVTAPHSNPEIHFPEALRDSLPFSALNTPAPELISVSTLPPQQSRESHINGAESFLSSLYADGSFPPMTPSIECRELFPQDKEYFPYDFPFGFDSTTLDIWDIDSSLLKSMYKL